MRKISLTTMVSLSLISLMVAALGMVGGTGCQFDSGKTPSAASPSSESEEVAEPVSAAPPATSGTKVTAESLTEGTEPIATTKPSATSKPPMAPVCDPGTISCGTGTGGACCKASQICCPGGVAYTYGCHEGKGPCPKMP